MNERVSERFLRPAFTRMARVESWGDLDDLPLSTRTKNALTDAGIVSIERLRQMDTATLKLVPNLGKRGLHEIEILLMSLEHRRKFYESEPVRGDRA